jgi:hypothetical protein
MSVIREAFDRIAVPSFVGDFRSRQAAIDDHWQTWQEAWEEATRVERERCATVCEERWTYSDGEGNVFASEVSESARKCAAKIRGTE